MIHAHFNCSEHGAVSELFELSNFRLVYETKDVSFAKDKTMTKKAIKDKDTVKVKLSVESDTDGAASLAGFTPTVLEFTAGNGEVCDALECAVVQMKKGEMAVLTQRGHRKPSLACWT